MIYKTDLDTFLNENDFDMTKMCIDEYEQLKELILEFTRNHVKDALSTASYKAKAFNKSKFLGDINPQVDMDSILNSYKLENIK